MASTEQGDMATDIFSTISEGLNKRAQIQARQLAKELLDPQDIDRTFPIFLERLLVLFATQSAEYNKVANNYIKVFTAAEGSPITQGVLLAHQAQPNQTAFIKRMTGAMVYGYKRKVAQGGVPMRELPKNNAYFAQSVNNMAKDFGSQVITQGRDTIAKVASEVYEGFSRKTNSGACNFCLMLATRADYQSKKSASFPSHRGCACTPEIVVDRSQHTPSPEAAAGYSRYLEQQEKLREKLGAAEYNARRRKQADRRDEKKGTAGTEDLKIRDRDRQIKDAGEKLEREYAEGKFDRFEYEKRNKRLNDYKEDNLLAKKKQTIRKERYAGDITMEEEIERIRKAERRAVERKASFKPKGALETANKADLKSALLGK